MIACYSGLPTIISTHNFLDTQGRRLSNSAIASHAVDALDNNPELVREKLISRHDQIFMVLCGHQHAQSMRVDPNRDGHTVYQILFDYQARGQAAKDAGRPLRQGAGSVTVGRG